MKKIPNQIQLDNKQNKKIEKFHTKENISKFTNIEGSLYAILQNLLKKFIQQCIKKVVLKQILQEVLSLAVKMQPKQLWNLQYTNRLSFIKYILSIQNLHTTKLQQFNDQSNLCKKEQIFDQLSQVDRADKSKSIQENSKQIVNQNKLITNKSRKTKPIKKQRKDNGRNIETKDDKNQSNRHYKNEVQKRVNNELTKKQDQIKMQNSQILQNITVQNENYQKDNNLNKVISNTNKKNIQERGEQMLEIIYKISEQIDRVEANYLKSLQIDNLELILSLQQQILKQKYFQTNSQANCLNQSTFNCSRIQSNIIQNHSSTENYLTSTKGAQKNQLKPPQNPALSFYDFSNQKVKQMQMGYLTHQNVKLNPFSFNNINGVQYNQFNLPHINNIYNMCNFYKDSTLHCQDSMNSNLIALQNKYIGFPYLGLNLSNMNYSNSFTESNVNFSGKNVYYNLVQQNNNIQIESISDKNSGQIIQK